ncbi:MAG: PASTA domain-containing protein, partial [Deinococcota bacterium]|nr:PASTA domain-containing protein [Deinococcota bacterium]
MPLLDGKYEIISQQPVDDTQTLFEATAPDGSAVTIVWYDLASAQEEWAFQHYRQTLRALKRQQLAAIFDLVSRPGAHYVAWLRAPQAQLASGRALPALHTALGALGRVPQEADIRADAEGKPQIYGLAFSSLASEFSVLAPEPLPVSKKAPMLGRERLSSWLPALALGLLGLGFFYASLSLRTDNSLVVVPPVAGRDANDVARQLYSLGLNVDMEALPSSQAAGEALGIDPRPGTQLRQGRRVLLRYALPPGQLAEQEVPDLRGQTFDFSEGEVQRALEEEGLELGRVARIASEAPRGTVLAQAPSAGSRALKAGSVDILISDGPQEARTFVPSLRGLSLEDALEIARLAGIDESRVLVQRVSSRQGELDTVLAQSPAPNTPFSRDQAVLNLTVAGDVAFSPGATPLPSLVGMSRLEAERYIAQADFELGEVKEISDISLPGGVVMQEPTAGALPEGGATLVTLTVNIRPVTIPELDATVEIGDPQPFEFPYRFLIEDGVGEG